MDAAGRCVFGDIEVERGSCPEATQGTQTLASRCLQEGGKKLRLVAEVAGLCGGTWEEVWSCDVSITSDAEAAKNLRKTLRSLASA